MNNFESNIKTGLYLVCNKNAEVVNVLFNDLALVDKQELPINFFTIIDKGSIAKASEFWDNILSNEFVFDTELFIKRKEGPVQLKFSAGTFNNQIWIIAASQNDHLEEMFDELMLINNEQQNLIRRAEKKLSKIFYGGTASFDPYDEISRVNNELVNAQRKLIKQNEEILRLNQELSDSNKELEHFAYSVSHDLKEPLRMVKSFMKLLNDRYSDKLDGKGQQFIQFATDGAERMEQLINELLDYSRIGREKYDVEKVDLNQVLRKVELLNKEIIDSSETSLSYPDMPAILFERVPLQQLFHNLVSNSLKYRHSERKLEIEIGYHEFEDYWKFFVSDNGMGISKENHEIIFDLFRRVSDDVNRTGTGMGLAICKKIVDEFGGKIWVESEEGKGSTFYFTVSKKYKQS